MVTVRLLGKVAAAWRGWIAILAGRPDHGFTDSAYDLAVAVAVYLALLLAINLIEVAGPYEILAGLVVNAIPLLLFAAVTFVTLRFHRNGIHWRALATPVVWAQSFVLILSKLLLPFFPPLNLVLYVALAFLLVRAAQVVGHLGLGSAVAYAALSVVALVATLTSLYMLLAPGPGPI